MWLEVKVNLNYSALPLFKGMVDVIPTVRRVLARESVVAICNVDTCLPRHPKDITLLDLLNGGGVYLYLFHIA